MLQEAQSFASIPAADLERAKKWYADKLGLTPTQSMPGVETYMCADGTAFILYETSFAGTGKHTIAGWRTSDLDKEMAQLRERGVKFEDYDFPGLKTVDGVAELDGVKSSWFVDSEGNTLVLTAM